MKTVSSFAPSVQLMACCLLRLCACVVLELRIQEQFRKMCESKAQLRDVMRSYGLPLPLRLLYARVLTPKPGDGHQAVGADEPFDALADHSGDATEAECLVAGPAKLVRRDGDGVPPGGQ